MIDPNTLLREKRSAKVPPMPLRIMHAGVYMYGGGAERWLATLARELNPAICVIQESVILGKQHYSRQIAEGMPFQVQTGSARSIRKAAARNDILMYWGPVPLNGILDSTTRPLCLFVAHTSYSRPSLLMGIAHVDHTIAICNRVAKEVCHDMPCSVIYPAADPRNLTISTSRDEIRKDLGLTPDDFVLGFVGSLIQSKRPGAIIEAISLLPNRFKALLLGLGEEESSLRKKGESISPQRIVFAATNQSVGNYYLAMDALALPSITTHEGFPLACLEAMHFSLPVLVTEIGDMPQLIQHKQNGWLLDDSALVPSIVDACKWLAQDTASRIAIGTAGQRMAASLGDVKSTARQFENLILRLWNERNFRETKAQPQPAAS